MRITPHAGRAARGSRGGGSLGAATRAAGVLARSDIVVYDDRGV